MDAPVLVSAVVEIAMTSGAIMTGRYATNVDWIPGSVHRFPGRLGLTCAPGLDEWGQQRGAAYIDEDLRSISRTHGASVLVTLLEDGEIESRLSPDFGARARRAGLELVTFPVADGWVPRSVAATVRLVETLLERLRSGRGVVLHCMVGLGRTGMLGACCLVACGNSPAEAMSIVRVTRTGSIQNPIQEAFVLEFASAWTDHRTRSDKG